MEILFSLLLGGFSILLIGYVVLRHGALKNELRNVQNKNKAVIKGHRIRDRLRRDMSFADRVRRRFKR